LFQNDRAGAVPPAGEAIAIMQIEITAEDQLLLVQVLERRVLDLEIEILHTDRTEYKNALKGHLAQLRQLLGQFKRPLAMAA
jgi:homoserine trans-succinylase